MIFEHKNQWHIRSKECTPIVKPILILIRTTLLRESRDSIIKEKKHRKAREDI